MSALRARRSGGGALLAGLLLVALLGGVHAQVSLPDAAYPTYKWTPVASNASFPVRMGPMGYSFNSTHFAVLGGRNVANDAVYGALIFSYDSKGVIKYVREDKLNLVSPIKLDRMMSSTTANGDTWYGVGGVDTTGQGTQRINSYTIRTGMFSTAPTLAGTSAPVMLAASTELPNCDGLWGMRCQVLQGGITVATGVPTSSIWYNNATYQWKPSTSGTAPAARWGHTLVADPTGTLLYMFGGSTAAATATDDFYAIAPRGFDDATTAEMTNIALGKPAIMSTQHLQFVGGPNRATDGVVTTILNALAYSSSSTYNLCAQSNTTLPGDQWLRIDLGSLQTIDLIRIYSRTDTVARNAGFKLYVNNVANWTNVTDPNFVPCPNPYADIVKSVAVSVTGTHCAVGRYIWYVLPYTKAARILGICELQAWRRNSWQWRQLSGTINAALGKTATQSLTNGAYTADLSVDGSFNNGNLGTTPYTCSSTASNAFDSTKPPWWVVDLGDQYEVSYLRIYARLDANTFRNQNFRIAIGNSKEVSNTLNTKCVVPFDITPGTGYYTDIPCVAKGRYVVISRPFVYNDTGANMLIMCDVQVMGSALSNMPAARTGHAATTFRGHMVIFGGQDKNGVRLNDLRLYSFAKRSWVPASWTVPISTAPSTRAYTLLFPLTSTRLLLFGGLNDIDAMADMWTLDFDPCGNYSMYRAIQSRSIHGDTSRFMNCTSLTTFSPSNGADPIVCQPDGTWVGMFPVCAGRKPGAPRNVVALTSPDPQTAIVQWQAPSSAGDAQNGTVTSYSVRSVDDSYFLRLTTDEQPADFDFSGAWNWYNNNGTGGAVYQFDGTGLVINANFNEDCNGGRMECVYTTRDWPANVDPTDWQIETRIVLQDSSVQPTSCTAGITMVDTTNGWPIAYGGLRYYSTGPSFNVGLETTNQAWKTWYDVGTTNSALYFKLTRTASTGTYEGWYRIRDNSNWIRLPQAFNASIGYGGRIPLPPQGMQIGFIVKNWNAGSRCFARFEYLRVANRTCMTEGITKTVIPSVNATGSTTFTTNITGVSGAAAYRFEVAASNEFGEGPATKSAAAFIQDVPDAVLASVVEIARGRPVTLSSTAVNGVSGLSYSGSKATDGVLTQVDNTNTPACAMTNTESFPYMRIDLGAAYDIVGFDIYGRSDANTANMDDFEVYVGNSNDVTLAVRCPSQDVPKSMALAPNRATFNCTVLGRYVIIRAVQARPLVVCEAKVYAANSCPRRFAPSSTPGAGSTCTNAVLGNLCSLNCAGGYAATYGTGLSLCRGSSWDLGGTACEPQCPSLQMPDQSATCKYTMVQESFDADAATIFARWATLSPWYGLPSNWQVVDGVLQSTGSATCGGEQGLLSRASNYGYRGNFDMYVTMRTSDRAGVLFRTAGEYNYYKFTVDVARGTQYLDRYLNGGYYRLVQVYNTVDPAVFHKIWVAYAQSTFDIYLDGTLVLTASDDSTNLLYGLQGVYASTTAEFSHFEITAPCTDACPALFDGRSCTFGCRTGFVALGDTTRTCTWPNRGSSVTNYTGTPLICTLPPPSFYPTTRSVSENVPVNTPVGQPVIATISAPDEQVNYQITNGNTFNAFWIDSCSGQIRVKNATIDFERQSVYNLAVRAYVAGYVGAETTVTITVTIINVVEPPVLADQAFSVSEAASPGTFIGRPVLIDYERATYNWRITVDGAVGRFVMHNATGNISVSNVAGALGLDYEDANSFILRVVVTNVAMPTITASASITINVLDANDAPVVTTNAVSVLETSAPSPAIGTSFSQLIVASDQDNQAGGLYASALSYALVPPSAAAAYNRSTCAWSATYATMPTVNGLAGGAPLLAIDAATGNVSFIALPTGQAWFQMTARVVQGQLVRASYLLCVNVSDANSGWSTRPVLAHVVADIPGQPVINGFSGGAAMSTKGGDVVVFSGSNFGTIQQRPLIQANFSLGTTMYSATACNVTQDQVEIRCTTPPGVGSGYTWRLWKEGVEMISVVPLTSSFATPTVTMVTGNAALQTEGNDVLTFVGANFGPPGTVVDIRFGNALEFVCNQLFNASDSHDVVRCVTPNFTTTYGGSCGINLPWQITVPAPPAINGLVVVNAPGDNAQLITHQPPLITGLFTTAVGARLDQVDTFTPMQIRIRGTNFGGNSCPVSATYGGNLGTLITMTGCYHEANTHRWVRCNTAPGQGVYQKATITIAGAAMTTPTSGNPSASLGFGYKAPYITQVYGPGATGSSTAGGTQFYIAGYQFPPVSFPNNPIDWVMYGPGLMYTATGCKVVAHVAPTTGPSLVQCTTAPGIGFGHSLQATFRGAATPLFAAQLNYSAPTVADFLATDVNNMATTGNELVYINGLNFGPADAYTNSRLAVSYATKLNDGPFDAITFTAANCSVSVAHIQLACTTAPGAGKNLQWSVVVAGVESRRPTTAYAPPVITSILVMDHFGAYKSYANPDGGDYIVLQGNSFGPRNFQGTGRSLVSSVTYGKSGTEYYAAGWGVGSDSMMLLLLPAGTGSDLVAQVQVADQLSALTAPPVSFSYDAPIIIAIHPSTRLPTVAPAGAPTQLVIIARNVPIYDPYSLVAVLVGNGGETMLLTPTVPTTVAGINAITNADGSRNYTVTLPSEGAGARIRVSIGSIPAVLGSNADPQQAATSGTFSAVVNSTSLIDYADPRMDNVAISKPRFTPTGYTGNFTGMYAGYAACPFAAGDATWSCTDPALLQMTIDGANFGSDPARGLDSVTRTLELLLGTNNATGVSSWSAADLYVTSWSHTTIVAYSHTIQGTVRVTLTSTGYNGEVTAQASTATYRDFNPFVSALRGATTGIPTEGYAPGNWTNPLLIDAEHLEGATDLAVTVGGRICPLWCPTSARECASSSEVKTQILDAVAPGPTAVWTLHCRLPAGQGTGQSVQLAKYSGASVTVSSLAATVDYAPPIISSLSVEQALNSGATVFGTIAFRGQDPGRTTITIPTIGTRVRIVGANLGTAPTILAGDGFVLSGAAVTSCAPNDTATGWWRHTCYEAFIPGGEGSGLQYPEYQTFAYGYKIMLAAGNQQSPFALLRYAAPTITAVTSASGTFPTHGGVWLTVTGSNFGQTTPGRPPANVSVSFSMPWLDTMQELCGNVTRYNHSTITCLLPAGSGVGLRTTVTVADVSGSATGLISYDRPVVTDVSVISGGGMIPSYIAWTPLPFAEAMTSGGTVIRVLGSNFGAMSPLRHCLFLMWTFRTSDGSRVPICDGRENFLGEGELSAANITSWDHDAITFVVPVGIGLKDIEVSVRGNTLGLYQGSPIIRRVSYQRPVITSMQAADLRRFPMGEPAFEGGLPVARGDTESETVIIIRGSGFGVTPFNMSAAPLRTEIFSPPLPLADAPHLPMTAMKIAFHKFCVSIATDVFALPAHGTSNCFRGVLSHKDDEVVFLAPPGVGRNRTVRVTFQEADGGAYLVSNPATFSYMPPAIDFVRPSAAYMGEQPGTISVYGQQFGNPEVADRQGWDAADRVVDGYVAGVQCANAQAVRQDGVTALQCGLTHGMPVGFQNVTILVAGQSAFVDKSPRVSTVQLVCKQGYFGKIGETCELCPAIGATCMGYLEWLTTDNEADKHTYPRPLPGFYSLNGTERSACPDTIIAGDALVAARDTCIVACEPPDACAGNNYCATGYASKAPYYRCASCANGFFMRGGQCAKCPESPAALIVGMVIVILAVAALGFWLNHKGVNVAMISIGVDFMQIVAIFGNARIQWPAAVKELMAIMNAFNLSIEIVAPECLVPDLGYKRKFFAILALPLSVCAVFVLTSLVLSIRKLILGRRGKQVWLSHISPLVAAFLMLFYFVYLYVSRTLLEIFNCVPTTPPDGKRYLQVVFEECGVPGGVQMALLPYAIMGFIIYTAGYPVTLGWWLWRNRFIVMEDQLLRAMNWGDDRLTGPRTYEFRRRFGRTYYQFTPDLAAYWILVLIIKKFFIASAAILFNQNSAFQMAACLLIIVIAYALQIRYRPYMSPGDREDVLKQHEIAVFTSQVHARLRDALKHVQARSRKRVRRNLLTFDGKIDRGAILNVLGSWWMNWNTLESGLLFAAFLVCLMAVMYQSQNSNPYYVDTNARDAVTAILLLAIVFALLYFTAVVVTEITMALQEQRLEAVVKKGAQKRPSMSAHRLKTQSVVIGPVEAQANPLFFRAETETGASSAIDSAHDAVMGSAAPPTPELWVIYRNTFEELQKSVTTLKQQVAEAKVSLQKVESARAQASMLEEAAGASARGVRAARPSKTAFQQTSTTAQVRRDSVRLASAVAAVASARSMPTGGAGATTAVSAQLSFANANSTMAARRKQMAARAKSASSVATAEDDE